LERARRFYGDRVGLTRIEDEVEGTIRYGCGGGAGLALFERPTPQSTPPDVPYDRYAVGITTSRSACSSREVVDERRP
jgi:hypothetical protein